MRVKAEHASSNPRGLLFVYGEDLPPGGVPFLGPFRRGCVYKCREALAVCADRWPLPNKRWKYKGRYVTGEMASGNEATDMATIQKITCWPDFYVWNFDTEKFELQLK